MLLDALNTACSCNDAVAVAFVASARNILPFMEVGEEQEIWAHVVGQIETKVEERSEKEWAVPTSISKLGIKFKPPTTEEIRISSKKVNITSLSQKLMAAAGPYATSPEKGQFETNGNPHWPQDDPESWNYEFSRQTAETVGEAINKSVGGLSVEGIDLPAFTKDMTLAISDHLTKISQAVSNATAGLQRRTNLLWWKEALFSPSAQMSYPRHDVIQRCGSDGFRHAPTNPNILTRERRRIPTGDSSCRFANARSEGDSLDPGN